MQRDPYHQSKNISIHALREEGDQWTRIDKIRVLISIHALREEGDQPTSCRKAKLSRFLSTPSARRATIQRYVSDSHLPISIHALREEGDSWRWALRM